MTMRIKMCFLAAVIAISFIMGSSAALASDTNFFSITSTSSSVQVGESFTVTVAGTNIEDLYAYEVNLTYDDQLLEFKNIVSNIPWYAVKSPMDGNKIKFAAAKMKNQIKVNGSVTFCTLTFTAKKTGNGVVRLNSIKLMNEILAETAYTVGKTAEVSIANEIETSTPTPTPTPTPKPGHGLTVTARPDINGVEVAEVDSAAFKAAIKNPAGGEIVVEVNSSEKADAIRVDIPALDMAELELDRTVKIKTEFAAVSINPKLLKNIIKPESAYVQLSIVKVENAALAEEVKKVIGENTVYDFNLSIDGKKVSGFGENRTVEVELSYTLLPEENPDNVIIYYIDDMGKLVVIKNGVYNPTTQKVKFTPLHFSKYTAVHRAAKFDDIANLQWAKSSIEALAARGIVSGVGKDAFNPNKKVTRAEFIQMLTSAFDLIDETAESNLSDVRKDAWYYNSVASAQKLGIAVGKTDGSFGVNDTIKREDMAVMAYKVAVLMNVRLAETKIEEFVDESQISGYAIEAVKAIQAANIMSGVGNQRFAPKNGATRAEAAVVIYKMFSLYWN